MRCDTAGEEAEWATRAPARPPARVWRRTWPGRREAQQTARVQAAGPTGAVAGREGERTGRLWRAERHAVSGRRALGVSLSPSRSTSSPRLRSNSRTHSSRASIWVRRQVAAHARLFCSFACSSCSTANFNQLTRARMRGVRFYSGASNFGRLGVAVLCVPLPKLACSPPRAHSTRHGLVTVSEQTLVRSCACARLL